MWVAAARESSENRRRTVWSTVMVNIVAPARSHRPPRRGNVPPGRVGFGADREEGTPESGLRDYRRRRIRRPCRASVLCAPCQRGAEDSERFTEDGVTGPEKEL
ncbi:hypothetical protein Acy02nite_34630 [Actinoplanes cyaneus]|uniref:Uncharacterized protein n=1 Tax=Actinoplanes cyaneus TaxID=52696 RepID=A0A919IJM6_9ACTN|nr:hypothetical protein Acy02nite_34630 [Actinoplanes cyaneus]